MEDTSTKAQKQWSDELLVACKRFKQNIVGTLFVSCTDRTNFDKLQKTITQLAENLKALSDPVPNFYQARVVFFFFFFFIFTVGLIIFSSGRGGFD